MKEIFKELKLDDFSPVVLFVYNRPLHTEQTIEALKRNIFADQSDLYIFSDGPKLETDNKQIAEVRKYIKQIRGFKSIHIIEQDNNMGLANSVISGVTSVINSYGKVIVLEDDLVTSPYFLKYMNEALEFYKNESQVFSISGYNHPPNLMKFPENYLNDIYFNYRNSSWGWGTWKDRWEKVDWEVADFNDFIKDRRAQNDFNRGGEDLTPMLKAQVEGKIDSWAIRWSYSHFCNNGLSVCPVFSYVNNIGMDASGTHCGKTEKYANDLTMAKRDCNLSLPVNVNEKIMRVFRKVYKKSFKLKVKQMIKNILVKN